MFTQIKNIAGRGQVWFGWVMKTRFVLDGDGWQYHHVVSRVVDRRVIFGEEEKAFFRDWLWRYAEFCGLRVVAYCLMGNHFHILVGFSRGEAARFAAEATDGEVIGRARAIYRQAVADAMERDLARFRSAGDDEGVADIRGRLLARMGDLSVFVQEIKRRFTRWYNGHHDRVGTLWESRFRSVLVEGSRLALETVAAYIDLNPVRAGLVRRPEDYRYCGYAEAVGGISNRSGQARRSIALVVDLGDEMERGTSGWWEAAQQRYRLLLFGRGAQTGILDAERLSEAVDEAGGPSRAEALRCRIRHLSEGGAMGSPGFLEEVFANEKEQGRFSDGRQTGARGMRGANLAELATLRDLQSLPTPTPTATD
ncbi:hypothetical protein BH23VER1_BH23VER1_27730 [soil metagenome]